MEKIFNINSYVKVKLTNEGLKILKSHHNEMLKQLSPQQKEAIGNFKTPVVDKDGYSEFQFWQLMNHFGKYMYNGNFNTPFFENIKISDEYLIDSDN